MTGGALVVYSARGGAVPVAIGDDDVTCVAFNFAPLPVIEVRLASKSKTVVTVEATTLSHNAEKHRYRQ